MPVSLLPVLPYILEHHIPAVAHAFTVLLRSDYYSIRDSYQILTACSLVCRSWCWIAQATLCRVAILARPGVNNIDDNNYLDTLDGAVINTTAFLYTLRARPELGPLVHSICFACFDDSFPSTASLTLALCPNVTVLTFTTRPATSLAWHLDQLGVYPSVRIFKHRGKGEELDALPEIDRCFPHLEELQGVTLETTMDDHPWNPRPREPARLDFRHLRVVHVYAPDRGGVCQLADGCPALALRTFRARSLDNLSTVAPFRHTLHTLDLFHFPLQPGSDNRDYFENYFRKIRDQQAPKVSFGDFPQLRVLRVRRCPAALFPWPLPPELETLAVNSICLLRHPGRTRNELAARPSLRRVTLFYEDPRQAGKGGPIEKLFDGLSLEYDLVLTPGTIPFGELGWQNIYSDLDM